MGPSHRGLCHLSESRSSLSTSLALIVCVTPPSPRPSCSFSLAFSLSCRYFTLHAPYSSFLSTPPPRTGSAHCAASSGLCPEWSPGPSFFSLHHYLDQTLISRFTPALTSLSLSGVTGDPSLLAGGPYSTRALTYFLLIAILLPASSPLGLLQAIPKNVIIPRSSGHSPHSTPWASMSSAAGSVSPGP